MLKGNPMGSVSEEFVPLSGEPMTSSKDKERLRYTCFEVWGLSPEGRKTQAGRLWTICFIRCVLELKLYVALTSFSGTPT
jgi:hypothetical protein